MAALVIALLVVVAALPASAKRVVNESYSEYQILGWMGSDDGSTDGEAWAIRGDNGEGMGINYSAGYDCEGAPADALAWINVQGEASLEEFDVPTKGKTKFTTGFATGSFYYGSIDWETCDGTQGGRDLGAEYERLTIEVLGTEGGLVKTSGSNSWHIPSETNNHQNERGTLRQAQILVTIPGTPAPHPENGFSWEGPGAVGQHSWSAHTNE